MRKRVTVAAVAVLALVFASVAYAQEREGTQQNTQTSIAVSGLSSTKGGTKKKPKQQSKLRLVIDSKAINGAGQAGTSTSIKSTLPKGWTFNTKRWPASKRCSVQRVNVVDKSTKSCSGGKVAGGITNVLANNGGIDCGLRLSAYVLKKESGVPANAMGTYVEGGPGVRVGGLGECPVQVNRMLVGTIKGGVWNVKIDTAVQEPTPGFPTGIKQLDFRFNGKVTTGKGKKRKTYGIAQSTGCSGGSWTFRVQNTYRIGGPGKTATDSVKCKK